MDVARLSEDEPLADMNLIPLIDVALTLLIIMMVTTAFIHKPGLRLQLPETATKASTPENVKDITLYLATDGGIFMDGEKKDPVRVQEYLNMVGNRNPMARVLLRGDHDVAYGHVMDAMDMVRQAHLTHIVLPSEPQIGAGSGSATTATPTAGASVLSTLGGPGGR